MLDTVLFDFQLSEPLRRQQLYSGRLFVFSPRASTIALCEFARSMIEEAFGLRDPRTGQSLIVVEEFVSICAPLKPRFIHDPRTLELIRDVVEELGYGLNDTYIDVPRLRMVTHGGYLTSGVGYAHHPIAIPRTRPQCASSIGGSQSFVSTRKVRWLSTPATGVNQSKTAQVPSITTGGTQTGERMRRVT